MLGRAWTIVEMTATRLELAVGHGTAVSQSRTERFNPPEPGADWSEVLRARHATLVGWVNELGLKNQPCVVLYHSPQSTCSVFSCPETAGSAAAERAATLALSEITGQSVTDNPSSTLPLWSDRNPIAKPGQAVAQKMAHTLGAMDTEANCQLLTQWINSCGLQAERLVPVGIGPIASLMDRIRSTSGNAVQAVLWFGEHESYFVVGDTNGLRLFRQLGMGRESLVEALQRPIMPKTGEGGPITLDRAAARGLLDRAGIPQPGDSVDERLGLVGTSVLPLMSPVLQRFSVEVKQSLRFGLSEQDRASVNVTIVGPGASLRRLGETVAQLCGVPVTPPPADAQTVTNDRSSATVGNIRAFIERGQPAISLLPTSLQQTQLTKRARRSLWIGIGVAAASVALYGGWLQVSLLAAKSNIDSLKAQADEATKLDQQQKAALAVQTNAGKALKHLNDTMGTSPDWAVVMEQIAQRSSKDVALSTIGLTLEHASGGGSSGANVPTDAVCRLTGSMKAPDDKAFADGITTYIASFSELPIVTSVKMGSTTKTKIGDADAFTFELTITLVEVPYRDLAPDAVPLPKKAVATAPTAEKGANQ